MIGNHVGLNQPWLYPVHHLRIYDEAFSPNDIRDARTVNDGPRYAVGRLYTGQRPLSAVETSGSCTNSFTGQTDSTDPEDYCAELCYQDSDCQYFSAYPVTYRHPGRCCFYQSYDSTHTAARDFEASPGGFFRLTHTAAGGTTGSDPANEWQTLLDRIHAQGCRWDDFSARLNAVDVACCSAGGNCPNGVPIGCNFFCAEVYVPLFDRCHDLLAQFVGVSALPQFDALYDTCLVEDAPIIRSVYQEVRTKQHCVYDLSFVDDRSSPGQHRRRALQGGHFGGGGIGGGGATANPRCPMTTFDNRVLAVDAACAVGQGQGVPTQCPSTQCALEFNPFYDDCGDFISRFLGSQAASFSALSTDCAGRDTQAILYLLESIDCDNTPYQATGLAQSRTPPAAQEAWTLGMSGGSFGRHDVGAVQFNAMFSQSPTRIVKRECTDCAASHREVYYKRLTPLSGIDLHEYLCCNWLSAHNQMNVDFKLYSSYADAINDVSPWTYCNYDDPGACLYKPFTRHALCSMKLPRGCCSHPNLL
jgi:hypothetical protein